ncbi:hypothetical protein HK098_007187 [Nowakowskiella sp. JEL0407]|nr:hypothetical protein HK098_007187 [Nowakowskiella sp. JEL0407]
MAIQIEDETDIAPNQIPTHATTTAPTGTITSSVINIANTMMGAGMLALPSAFAIVGLGFGMFLLVLAGVAAAFGMYLLVESARRVGRSSSFFAVSKITYPSAAIIFDSAIAIKCFGVSVSYLVIWGDLVTPKKLPKVVLSLTPNISPDSYFLMKETWVTIGIISISPFVFLRRLDSLKYISALALSSIVYLVFIVVFYFIFPLDEMPPKLTFGEIEWIKFDLQKFLTVLPIFVFAYTCHQNVFSVYNELIDNSSERIFKVITTSSYVAHWTYQLVAILGYLTFGNSVSSNIIANYPNSAMISFGQLAIALLVLLSYPLQAHPARASLDKVVSGGTIVTPIPRIKFVLLSLFLITASYIIAIKVKNLSTVLSIVGATGSTTIGYILPGLFYWRIREDEDIAAEEEQERLLGVNGVVNGNGSSEQAVKLDLEGIDPMDNSGSIIHNVLHPTEHTPLLGASSASGGSTAPVPRRRTRAKNPKWDFTNFMAALLACAGIVLMASIQLLTPKQEAKQLADSQKKILNRVPTPEFDVPLPTPTSQFSSSSVSKSSTLTTADAKSRIIINSQMAKSWQPETTHLMRSDARIDQKRRFHAVRDSMYPLPADIQEQYRLELQHYLFCYGFNALFHMPLHQKMGKKGQLILDVGCGPSAWMRNVAELYPRSCIWGVDMAKSLFEGVDVLPNMKLFEGNVLERLPFEDNTFDGIYQRLMVLSIPSDKWDHVVAELIRVLKPGGYLEFCEPDFECLRMGPKFFELAKALNEALAIRGVNPNIAYELGDKIKSAGLQLISEHTCSFPIGWGGKNGELHLHNIRKSFMGLKPYLSKTFGISSEEYDNIIIEATNECETYETYYNAYAIVGRKNINA